MNTSFYNFNIEKLNPLNVGDLEKFLTKNSSLRDNYFYPHPFSLDYIVFLIVKKTRDFYCVAKIGDSVVAYGLLRGWEENYEIPSLGVAVDRDFRHMGIGTFMCQYLHFVAKLRGCEKVRLRVNKKNIIAYNMYEKFGYVFKDNDEDHYEGILELK